MSKYINLKMLIYLSLVSFSLGLFISISFTALEHVFLLIPALYFLKQTDFKKWQASTWFLLLMSVAFILSVLVNQDIANKGYAPILKVKYYIFGVLSITPFSYYFSKLSEEERTKKVKQLINFFIAATSLAAVFGLFSVALKFNIIKWVPNNNPRNSGFAGMLLNYAHNLALFQVILTGLVCYKEECKKFVNTNLIYAAWILNFIALYMTYSRGPLLAFLVAAPIYFYKNHKKQFITVVVLIFILSPIAYFNSKTLSKRPSSTDDRFSQWKSAVAGFKERPVLGLGFMNFEHLSIPLKNKYNIPGNHFGGHAHSNYFEVLASTGFIGFILFIGWQVFWFKEMLVRDDLIARISLPFIVAFVVGGLTQATFTLGANLFFIMTIYSITKINFEIIEKQKKWK